MGGAIFVATLVGIARILMRASLVASVLAGIWAFIQKTSKK